MGSNLPNSHTAAKKITHAFINNEAIPGCGLWPYPGYSLPAASLPPPGEQRFIHDAQLDGFALAIETETRSLRNHAKDNRA
jgi:hypothetical protein